MRWLKRSIWLVVLGAVAFGLWRGFQPQPVLVDAAGVRRGALAITADDDGRTRVRDRYTISAPVRGRLLRPPLEAGDTVRARETLVAEFAPIAADPLDARARAEAVARERRAQAALRQARAELAQAAAQEEYASAELRRAEELRARDNAPPRALDAAVRDARQAREAVRAAEFRVAVAEYELELANATLRVRAADQDGLPAAVAPSDAGGRTDAEHDGVLRLRSPIDGAVLRVFEESARTMPAGTAILDVGDVAELEIVADFLSQQAVKMRPGMPVEVHGFGGETEAGAARVLGGRVRRIEPGGFTRVSALGIEEQRVNVIVDPDPEQVAAGAWARLGDGYRVEVRVELWRGDDLLLVPAGALFRWRDQWAVFVVRGEVAERVIVQLGRRGPLESEVRDGLVESDEVVLYPTEMLVDGGLVKKRGAER